MHKLGIIDESGLVRAYQDLGYTDERAKGLADFTVVYNQSPEERDQTSEDAEKKRQKEATRGAVIKAYQTDIVTEEVARGYLEALVYKPSAVELYLANADYAVEEDVQDEQIKIVHDAFVRRIYDYTATVAALGELNLPALQAETLMVRWSAEKDAKTNRPSKKELFKLFEAKIITEAVLRVELAGHGYTDKYIEWYMKLNV